MSFILPRTLGGKLTRNKFEAQRDYIIYPALTTWSWYLNQDLTECTYLISILYCFLSITIFVHGALPLQILFFENSKNDVIDKNNFFKNKELTVSIHFFQLHS